MSRVGSRSRPHLLWPPPSGLGSLPDRVQYQKSKSKRRSSPGTGGPQHHTWRRARGDARHMHSCSCCVGTQIRLYLLSRLVFCRSRIYLPPVSVSFPAGVFDHGQPTALLDELLRQHLSTPFNPRTTATPACPPLYPAMTQIPLAPSTATTPPTSPPPPPKVTAHLGMRAAPGGPS